jgi:signal transduction histidine kinase
MLILDLQSLLWGLLLLWFATIGLTLLWAQRCWARPPRETAADLRANEPAWVAESTQFLSDLAHELRTPLATLLTHLEVLRSPRISEETRQQSIFLMQQEGKRMARLVHDLLELGYLETAPAIEQRPVNLCEVIHQTIGQIAPLAEERQMTISVHAEDDLVTLGDADRLRQVFLCLLDNAVKYSRVGDAISVTLHRQTEHTILCEVCDTGPGIPAEHLPHVTKRFYRGVSEEIGGSGLGLAVVKEILLRHHSTLEITSQTEGTETGTTVRFVLKALCA